MSLLPNFDPFAEGDRRVSAAVLNELVDQVRRMLIPDVGTLLDVGLDYPPQVFVAELTGFGTTAAGDIGYAWTEQRPAATATGYEDRPDGLSGTVAVDPARPLNGGEDAGIGDLVVVFPGWASVGGSGSGSGSGPPTVERGWRFLAPARPSFLATLTAKDYSGPFIAYSWTRVEGAEVLSNPADPNSPKTVVYTLTGQSGGPGNFPAYHEQNVDLVVCDNHSGSGSGSGISGSGTPIATGPACYCAGRVLSAVNAGGGNTTWTFDSLQCCESGTLIAATGACAPCQATIPCPGGTLVVTAPNGTYVTTPGYWAQLGTLCRPTGDETPETCVVRLRKGKGDWYFVDHEPRWEVVEITAGSGGSYTGFVLGYDQVAGSLFRFQAAYIIDANSLP